jgi:hypothetical protein
VTAHGTMDGQKLGATDGRLLKVDCSIGASDGLGDGVGFSVGNVAG